MILLYMKSLPGEKILTEMLLGILNAAVLSQALVDLYAGLLNCLLGDWSLSELYNSCIEFC